MLVFLDMERGNLREVRRFVSLVVFCVFLSCFPHARDAVFIEAHWLIFRGFL